MKRLIQKSGYIKPKSGGHYAEYIATREGVELMGAPYPSHEGNQFAQYTLGKLYLTGENVARDREQAYSWFRESVSQGNEYAQFFLDHFNDNHSPNVLLSTTKLHHHMGCIFQDNSVPPCPPGLSLIHI